MCFNGNESMFFASERQPSQHKSFFGLLFAAAAQSFFLQTDAKKKNKAPSFPSQSLCLPERPGTGLVATHRMPRPRPDASEALTSAGRGSGLFGETPPNGEAEANDERTEGKSVARESKGRVRPKGVGISSYTLQTPVSERV